MKTLSLFLLLSAFSLLTACSSTDSKTPTTTNPKTSMVGSDPSIMELVIDGSMMEFNEDFGKLSYCPDCMRKSNAYTYYLFDERKLVDVVGTDYKTKTFKLKVEATMVENKSSKPEDPMLSAPDGGFNYTYYDCTILEYLQD